MRLDPERTLFTADLHLGERNIIRNAGRPFSCPEEMDEALVANWNRAVGPKDVVFVLGDLTMRPWKHAAAYLERLNGREKHLVFGNHDDLKVRKLPHWASAQYGLEVDVGAHRVTLLHYGMRVWNKSSHGSLHLYGHSHGRLPGDRQSCDVGVDNPAFHMRPVRMAEVLAHLATLPERPRPTPRTQGTHEEPAAR